MKYVVVGSGPSGANAALTLLRRGKTVELWDVGRTELPTPDGTFSGLRNQPNPQRFFLGEDHRALIPPGGASLMSYPPARRFFVDRADPFWPFAAGNEFDANISFATGGLAAGWGANALAWADDDRIGFPEACGDWAPVYAEACRRMPIAGPEEDDLSSDLIGTHVSQPALNLGWHSGLLYSVYRRRARRLKSLGVSLGQARMAVITAPDDPRRCQYCDRCLWGCPPGAIYNPAVVTLDACRRFPQFAYCPGRLVTRLSVTRDRAHGVEFIETATGRRSVEPADVVMLAAGAIQTGAIFLRTLQQDENQAGEPTEKTVSLMDTSVVRIPYIFPKAWYRGPDELEGFQFNRLILGVTQTEDPQWPRYIHAEVLSLPALLYHPLIEALPFGSRLSKRFFFQIKPALGAVTVFLPDRAEPGNHLALAADPAAPTGDRIVLRYRDSDAKRRLSDAVTKTIRSALLNLGCLPSPLGVIDLPPGAGLHYAGTVPISVTPDVRCVDPGGRSYAYGNVYVADGAAFPTLPSKSITLNLVANAIRTASAAS